MDGWTGQSQDGTPGSGRGGVLLTDVTAGGAALGGAAGRAQASHLSLPFWMEAWPRLALSRSGEFLLRFVLVERTLFCGEEGEELYHRKPKWSQNQLPPPLSTMSSGRVWGLEGRKDVALTLGGKVFYSKHKWARREGQAGSQRELGLLKEGAASRGQAPEQEAGWGWPGGRRGRGSPWRAWGWSSSSPGRAGGWQALWLCCWPSVLTPGPPQAACFLRCCSESS